MCVCGHSVEHHVPWGIMQKCLQCPCQKFRHTDYHYPDGNRKPAEPVGQFNQRD